MTNRSQKPILKNSGPGKPVFEMMIQDEMGEDEWHHVKPIGRKVEVKEAAEIDTKARAHCEAAALRNETA